MAVNSVTRTTTLRHLANRILASRCTYCGEPIAPDEEVVSDDGFLATVVHAGCIGPYRLKRQADFDAWFYDTIDLS